MAVKSLPQRIDIRCPNIQQLNNCILVWGALTPKKESAFIGTTPEAIVEATKIPLDQVAIALGNLMGDSVDNPGCVQISNRKLENNVGYTARYFQKPGYTPVFVILLPANCGYSIRVE